MPKVVDELPDEVNQYPWHEWMDGQVRLFTHDVDFGCSPKSFIRLARRAGWREKRKVQARLDAAMSQVYLRFGPPGGETPQ